MAMSKTPVAETGMLIRKPVAAVFDACVDPAITTKFWFTGSTGKLEKGKSVSWTWSMYNHTALVDVKDIVANNKIEIYWGAKDAAKIRSVWTFDAFTAGTTFVQIASDGFEGSDEAIMQQVSDITGGFCWVLAGLKAWLEFGIQLNVVADRFPRKPE